MEVLCGNINSCLSFSCFISVKWIPVKTASCKINLNRPKSQKPKSSSCNPGNNSRKSTTSMGNSKSNNNSNNNITQTTTTPFQQYPLLAEHMLDINRSGRILFRDKQSIPLSVWPVVLGRVNQMFADHPQRRANAMFYMLRNAHDMWQHL